MIQKLNKLWLGIVLGLLVPAILYFIFFHPKMKHFSFIGDYYGSMLLKALPMLVARCIFPNALLFFLLLWQNITETAKGVLWTTAVITAILLFLSFIL